jgi:hypothetical protein
MNSMPTLGKHDDSAGYIAFTPAIADQSGPKRTTRSR